MTTFVSAQYVVNEMPPPEMLIRAVDEDGTVWWLDDDCQQGDWLRFKEQGGTVRAATEAKSAPPRKKRK